MNLDSQKGQIEIKKITNVDDFFEYWIGFINENGFKLNTKIFKLVDQKFNIKDGHHMSEMEEDILFEILGDPYDNF